GRSQAAEEVDETPRRRILRPAADSVAARWPARPREAPRRGRGVRRRRTEDRRTVREEPLLCRGTPLGGSTQADRVGAWVHAVLRPRALRERDEVGALVRREVPNKLATGRKSRRRT